MARRASTGMTWDRSTARNFNGEHETLKPNCQVYSALPVCRLETLSNASRLFLFLFLSIFRTLLFARSPSKNQPLNEFVFEEQSRIADAFSRSVCKENKSRGYWNFHVIACFLFGKSCAYGKGKISRQSIDVGVRGIRGASSLHEIGIDWLHHLKALKNNAQTSVL